MAKIMPKNIKSARFLCLARLKPCVINSTAPVKHPSACNRNMMPKAGSRNEKAAKETKAVRKANTNAKNAKTKKSHAFPPRFRDSGAYKRLANVFL